MSNICELLREMIKDEKKAPSDYEKIKKKMLGHKTNKETISKIQDDERRHYKEVKDIAVRLGCNCSKT